MKNPARHEIHWAAAPPTSMPEAGPDAGGGGVPGNRTGALLALGEARGEQRQGGRGHDSGTHTLQRASGDEPPAGGGDADQERCGDEHGQPGDEHPAASQQVTQPRAEQQQAAEDERVGVLHPGQPGGAQVAVAAAMDGSPVKMTELSSRMRK